MSTGGRMTKGNAVCAPRNTVSGKKEGYPVICNNTNEPSGYCAKWVKEWQILHGLIGRIWKSCIHRNGVEWWSPGAEGGCWSEGPNLYREEDSALGSPAQPRHGGQQQGVMCWKFLKGQISNLTPSNREFHDMKVAYLPAHMCIRWSHPTP